MSNSSTINIDIAISDKGVVSALKKVVTDIDAVGKAVKKTSTEMESSGKSGAKAMSTIKTEAHAAGATLGSLTKSAVIMTGAFFGIQAAAQAVFWEFKRGLRSVEDFNLAVAESASFISTFSERTKSGDLAGGFREANDYAKALNTKLEMMDSLTIASGKDLQTMSATMLQHGVILDINNKRQVEGFTNIATALTLVTQGQNKDIQMRQEINALLMGQIRATDRLPKLLSAIDPYLEKHLIQWKTEGTLIENVGSMLQGFATSSGDLGNTWAVVGSTLETIHNRVLRGAFQPAFDDLLGLAKDISKALIDAEGNLTPLAQSIQNDIASGYRTVRDLAKEYGGEVMQLAGYLLAAKTTQIAFNAAIKANPYLVAASGMMLLNEQMKNYNMNLGSIPGKYKDFINSLEAMRNGTKQFYDPATGKIVQEQLTEEELILRRIADLKNQMSGDKEWYQFSLFDDPAEEKRHISEVTGEITNLEGRLTELAAAREAANEMMREKGRSGGFFVPKLTPGGDPDSLKKIEAEQKRHAEEVRRLEEQLSRDINQQKLSRYQYAVWSIDQEVAKMRETAGANQKIQDEITEYRKLKLAEAAEFGNMYSDEEQTRLVEMKDTFMKMEEIKSQATEENYREQMALEEELNAYLENAGNDRLGSELARLEKRHQKMLEIAGSDMELQAKVAEWYRLKQEEIQKDAWKTEKELLLSSGKIADGFRAAMLEIQNDYVTMGDVAYDTFMDVRDTFRDEVGNYLVEQFGGIEGEWGGLWDRALQRFGSFLADMVMGWAAAIAEMVAVWAASEIAEMFGYGSGSGFTFSLSGSGKGSSGSSLGSNVASTAVSYAAEEYLGMGVSDYIMSEVVYPAIAEVGAAITGSTSASAAAAASAESGVIASGQASPAIMEAYASGYSAALTGASSAAAAAAASSTSISAGTATPAILDAYAAYYSATTASTTAASGAAAGTGASTAGTTGLAASIGSYAGPIGVAAAMAYMIYSGRSQTRDKLNSARTNPWELGALGGIGLDGQLTNVSGEASKALGLLIGEVGNFEQISIDAANGVMVLGNAVYDTSDAQTGLITTMGYQIEQFNAATGVWERSEVKFSDLLDQMEKINPTTDAAIAGTAAMVAEMNGIPTVADELAQAFGMMQTGIYGLGGAAASAAGTISGAIAMMGTRGENYGDTGIFDLAPTETSYTAPNRARDDDGMSGTSYVDGRSVVGGKGQFATWEQLVNSGAHGTMRLPDGTIRTYASGGDHPGGWRLVGEIAPELEATGRSRIFDHKKTKDIFSGGTETAKQIAELKEVIVSAVMISAERMRKIENTVDRWERTGLPAARTA